ncbi:MAG: hypothetical protein A4E35_02077 [Methanoregula sp. PtaU1.Bin051]|nr:MAG: hypothetical protein A4E35_02077 [Methanoregula sp. PtaU1.Bin051]
MTAAIPWRGALDIVLCCSILLALISGVHAAPDDQIAAPEPVVYLNMNEGSGQYAIDFSGKGASGEIHDVTRIRQGACANALFFNGIDSFVAIPFRSSNHPQKEITVDLWFAVDSYGRQVLVSTYNQGGYRIAFDDGDDLWWTVNTAQGDVSVAIQHESIPLHRWHHLAGTYDGRTSKIYLDGVLRNTANGSGNILYSYANDVMLGADAGTGNQPDPQCNGYFKGGLDELRIYDHALTYGQVMDDRFTCPQEPRVPEFTPTIRTLPAECSGLSATLNLLGGTQATRRIIISGPDQSATFNVQVPAGGTLYAGVTDAYALVYPDTWYIEIEENGRRLTRAIAFPNTINTPADAIIASGNATVVIRYFDGTDRFPSSAYVTLRAIPPPAPPVLPPSPIFSNPIIVIYTASWATLIAIIVVIYWLHLRSKGKAG